MDANDDYDLVLDRARDGEKMNQPTADDMLFSCTPEELQTRLMTPLQAQEAKPMGQVDAPPNEEALISVVESVELKGKEGYEAAEALLVATVQKIEGTVCTEGAEFPTPLPLEPPVITPVTEQSSPKEPSFTSTVRESGASLSGESGSLSYVSHEKSESNRRFDTSSIIIDESARYTVKPRIANVEDMPQVPAQENQKMSDSTTAVPNYNSPLQSVTSSTEHMSSALDTSSLASSPTGSTETRSKRRHPIVRQLIRLKKKFSTERS